MAGRIVWSSCRAIRPILQAIFLFPTIIGHDGHDERHVMHSDLPVISTWCQSVSRSISGSNWVQQGADCLQFESNSASLRCTFMPIASSCKCRISRRSQTMLCNVRA